MNVCTLIHGYGRDRLPRDVAEPTPLTPEEREKIEDVLSVAESSQFALLEGLRALGDLMGSAAAEEIDSTNTLASGSFLVSELATTLLDGFRHLEQDLQFRLRLADGVGELEPRGGKAKGRAREPKV